MTSNQFTLFLFGTFVSSLGNLVFFLGLLGFLRLELFSVGRVAICVGFIRGGALLVQSFSASSLDRISPKKLLISSEILAALTSFSLLMLWPSVKQNFQWFVLFATLRASVLAVQGGVRSKLMRELSGDSALQNSRTAVWLNKVTHGSIVIASVLSLWVVRHGSMEAAILIDFASFIVNGIIMWRLPMQASAVVPPMKWYSAFVNLYRYVGNVALFDLFLAVVMMGTNLFIVRLAGDHPERTSIYFLAYGIAIWVAGFADRAFFPKLNDGWIWSIIALSYVGIVRNTHDVYLTFVCALILYLAYWLLFHRYSARIQHQAPAHLVAGIATARNSQMLAILVAGEFFVGTLAKAMPIELEGGWRALLCVVIAVWVLGKSGKQDHA